jgi:hypothetical protein
VLLEEIYQPIASGEQQQLESFYSKRLQELVAQNLQQNDVDTAGELIDPIAPAIVGFNPFLNRTERLYRTLP